MSQWIDVLRWAHVIGATVLLGTGAGIAFFMVMAMRDARPLVVAHVAATVVIADFVFTAAAVVVQPITGILLARALGWPLDSGWLLVSLGLYVFVGVCRQPWLAGENRMPVRVIELYRIWLALGVPAFAGVLGILWLMLTTPEF